MTCFESGSTSLGEDDARSEPDASRWGDRLGTASAIWCSHDVALPPPRQLPVIVSAGSSVGGSLPGGHHVSDIKQETSLDRIVAAVSRAVTAACSDGPNTTKPIMAAAACLSHRACDIAGAGRYREQWHSDRLHVAAHRHQVERPDDLLGFVSGSASARLRRSILLRVLVRCVPDPAPGRVREAVVSSRSQTAGDNIG
jgi:hypothetical protein